MSIQDIATALAAIETTYPVVAQGGADAPFIVYGVDDAIAARYLDGGSGLTNYLISVVYVSKSYPNTVSKAQAINDALVAIGGVRKSRDEAYYKDDKLYEIVQQYSFWFDADKQTPTLGSAAPAYIPTRTRRLS